MPDDDYAAALRREREQASERRRAGIDAEIARVSPDAARSQPPKGRSTQQGRQQNG